MIKFICGIFDRLFVLTGALVFSQMPLYMQQYTQQLSGHASEIHYQVLNLEKAAEASHKTLPQYIVKFTENTDADFMRQGELMQGQVDRWQNLNQALVAIQSSTVFTRPLVFMTYLNSEVAYSTWLSFEYGIAFNVEGICYALLGCALGYAIFWGIVHFFKSILNLFRRKQHLNS